MKSAFPWLTPAPEAEFWKDCLFVFDTNVYLTLYRVHHEARTSMLDALTAIKDRVWVPHQVAKEFMKNRRDIISTHRQIATKILTQFTSDIRDLDKEFGSTRYAKEVIRIIEQGVRPVEQAVKAFGDQYGCEVDNDPVLDRLDALFSACMGKPYSREQFAEKVKEFKKRILRGMPPGIADVVLKGDKATSPTDDPEQAELSNIYGDVVLWHQIMDFCRERKVKRLVFVTDDVKAGGFWRKADGERNVNGAAPELQQELYESSETTLRMYKLEYFLQQQKKLLHQEIDQKVISEVRDAQRTAPRMDDRLAALRTLLDSQPSSHRSKLARSVADAFSRLWRTVPTQVFTMPSDEYEVVLSRELGGLFLQDPDVRKDADNLIAAVRKNTGSSLALCKKYAYDTLLDEIRPLFRPTFE